MNPRYFLSSRDDQSPSQGDGGGGPAPDPNSGVEAGASGSSSAMSLSTGGLVAIVVVVVVVVIVGVTTATLFFIAKKREWTVRETLRRSARKVVAAITPRRTEFPDSVKESMGSSRRGRAKRDNSVPPTPRLRPEDVEKGLAKSTTTKKSRQ
ncbi:transmembrane alpha-helix domain-containing protein [Purpureocillium lavendulum]|uniref:Transmembrane alpha-helix domain-containing protein n=1 Tax=Purpureocillium lavendulum TaxID=1247861 RepID=A0AB34FT67_9HYPO|nr:transmembrane alpha-helix domain-containing protein [Purpureocillium lavendulum]